jgi:hypothetical protein
MKIFWAWQSDTPGNIGRHFVRDALNLAIEDLRAEVSIEEPEREALHLDHDRKDVPGSPDLVRTILEKIDNSVVFIADVTPVGKTEAEKPLMNPNVAIELGYALSRLGDGGVLMALNQAYGDRESLPFDLRHKAGPILYSLAEGSRSDSRKSVQRQLVGSFKAAIRACLTTLEMRPIREEHQEIPAVENPAQYFRTGDTLAVRGSESLVYGKVPLLYLRVIPTSASQILRNAEVKDIVRTLKAKPLEQDVAIGAQGVLNDYGGITYSGIPREDGTLLWSSTQVFRNRELWGISSMFLFGAIIPMKSTEITIERGFRHYLRVARAQLCLNCPLLVEAGIARARGLRFDPEGMRGWTWGPIHAPDISCRVRIESFEESEIIRVLLEIFGDFFDAVGEPRPVGFRGFPPQSEATEPK